MVVFHYKLYFSRIFARGADGGSDLFNQSGGKGALVRGTFYLQEGDTLFLLVGQAGSDACHEVSFNVNIFSPKFSSFFCLSLTKNVCPNIPLRKANIVSNI